MSFTRFNYDEARTKKQLQESISVGLYHLDTPGPGINTSFLEALSKLEACASNRNLASSLTVFINFEIV